MGALLRPRDVLPPPESPIKSQHRYDRVHDSYGPGVFLGWVLVAYGIAAHYGSLREHPSSAFRLLDKDLVLTLAYPLVVATHLLSQFATYPGPKSAMWTTGDETLMQYSAAIQAANTVCIVALGVNIVLCVLLRSSRRRVLFVGVASVWILSAVTVVNASDEVSTTVAVVGVLGAAGLFAAIPVLLLCALCGPLLFVVSAGQVLYALWRGSRAKFGESMWIMMSIVVYSLVALPVGWFVVYAAGVSVPVSKHFILDLGQASAVLFGFVNLAFSCHAILREHVPGVMGIFYKDVIEFNCSG